MVVSKFNYISIPRTTINGVRYYACPDGTNLPSVTTILDKTKPAEVANSLKNWQNAIGVNNAAAQTTIAASRGTIMHSFLEKFIKDGVMIPDGNAILRIQGFEMAKTILSNWLGKVTTFYGSEISLYLPNLYAGTTDCVAEIDGELTIIDFKQSNKVKTDERVQDYKMQLAAYIEAHNELYKTDIKQGVILMCTPNLEFQHWVVKGEELVHYRGLWFDRLTAYYSKLKI